MECASRASRKFDDALRRYTEYSHRVLHLGVDAGLLSQEAYDEIVKKHPVYVRITRRHGGDGASASAGGRAVNRRTGGFDHILDPVDALLMDHAKFLRACFQAKTLQFVVRTGEQAAESPGGRQETAVGTVRGETGRPRSPPRHTNATQKCTGFGEKIPQPRKSATYAKRRKPLCFTGCAALLPTFQLVPEEGLEPSRPRERQILSLLRLPLRHSGKKDT